MEINLKNIKGRGRKGHFLKPKLKVNGMFVTFFPPKQHIFYFPPPPLAGLYCIIYTPAFIPSTLDINYFCNHCLDFFPLLFGTLMVMNPEHVLLQHDDGLEVSLRLLAERTLGLYRR